MILSFFFRFSCRQELRLQQMPECFQNKSEFETTRKVTSERRNRKLSNLLKTIREKKLEKALQQIKVWQETERESIDW
jgi:hypothetical protein